MGKINYIGNKDGVWNGRFIKGNFPKIKLIKDDSIIVISLTEIVIENLCLGHDNLNDFLNTIDEAKKSLQLHNIKKDGKYSDKELTAIKLYEKGKTFDYKINDDYIIVGYNNYVNILPFSYRMQKNIFLGCEYYSEFETRLNDKCKVMYEKEANQLHWQIFNELKLKSINNNNE